MIQLNVIALHCGKEKSELIPFCAKKDIAFRKNTQGVKQEGYSSGKSHQIYVGNRHVTRKTVMFSLFIKKIKTQIP